MYAADINALYGLRQSAIDALMSPVCSADDCTALKRYYAYLVRLTDKFPKLLQHQRSEVQESYDHVEVVEAEELAPPLTFAWLVYTTNFQYQ